MLSEQTPPVGPWICVAPLPRCASMCPATHGCDGSVLRSARVSTRTAPHHVHRSHTRRAAAGVLAAALMLAVSVGSVGAMATASSAAPAGAGLECFGATATIVGTPGDDVIRGTNGPDVIVGERGDDRINGRGGDDLICGRSGDDKILGGKGDDRVRGRRGGGRGGGGPRQRGGRRGPPGRTVHRGAGAGRR